MRDEYTIGWICALRDELTAAMTMLDETHGQLPQSRTDNNSYGLGRIGGHNVVLAGLPAGWTGKESAAIVATNLKSTFPSVRLGLMVGVGGGAPSEENDIRLGDIVVSKPGPTNGGVVQYDFGKTIEQGEFIQTGALSLPPLGLLTAMTSVQAKHRLSHYEYLQHLENLPDGLDLSFSRPEIDLQFVADYDHVGNAPTCEQCSRSPEKVKQLALRDNPIPRVFYGTIACADQVMRHGKTRERIAKQSHALCFEMEAAGLMNNFPCVVIRGICDYADSHKNKQWQPYAALAAAAYAKELLNAVAVEDVVHEIPIPSRLAGTSIPTAQASTLSLISETPSKIPFGSEAVSRRSSCSTKEVEGFFSVLNKKVLQSGTVALGRLVLDIHSPWEDFCPSIPKPSDNQVGVSLQFRFQDIAAETRHGQDYDKLAGRLAAILQMENPLQALESASEKTYVLSNAGDWFENACAAPETRRWLERMIQAGFPVYMTVGIHTVSNFPSTTTEIIVAIQYRKVVFGWLRSRDLDSATLERGRNIWQPTLITKGSEEVGAVQDEELVEARLQDTFDKKDMVDEDFFILGHRTFVL